jgi:hypothetical protein
MNNEWPGQTGPFLFTGLLLRQNFHAAFWYTKKGLYYRTLVYSSFIIHIPHILGRQGISGAPPRWLR